MIKHEHLDELHHSFHLLLTLSIFHCVHTLYLNILMYFYSNHLI